MNYPCPSLLPVAVVNLNILLMFSTWHTPMPPGYEAYSPMILMAGFYLLRNILGGLATGDDQLM